jgi:hypothetical protein
MEKNKYTLVIPEGWTKKEYIQGYHDGDMPEEEHTSFWDKPFDGNVFEIALQIFFVFLKCFLFFLATYDNVHEEECLKREKNVTSLPRQGVRRLVPQNDTK